MSTGAGLEGPSSGVGPAASSNGVAGLLRELVSVSEPIIENFVQQYVHKYETKVEGLKTEVEVQRERFEKVSTKHHVMLL